MYDLTKRADGKCLETRLEKERQKKTPGCSAHWQWRERPRSEQGMNHEL